MGRADPGGRMSLPPPPFSEPLRLNQIGAGATRDLEPDEAARARIARTLDLIELPVFKARLTVKPADTGWTLSGQVTAHAVQRCGLTLEPLPADIDESFAIDWWKPIRGRRSRWTSIPKTTARTWSRTA
ncbi:YceD family protein [Brevundimonas abyssalis]|uniref:YceD family protein n=1 Tax=Brevundimonas abyssalis TaxID=1125965 RepID=UPI001F5A9E3F|nr:hypothetical protein [Brevundimonas abyssalis]